ncbi:MAG: CotH kinase family protein [Gemmataceae bacterium]
MKMSRLSSLKVFPLGLMILLTGSLSMEGQENKEPPRKEEGSRFKEDFPPFGKGGGFPGGFPGGPPGGAARKLVQEFDQDGDGRLNKSERDKARASLESKGGGKRGPGFGGPKGGRGKGGFGPGGQREPGKPGPKVSPDQVKTYDKEPLYDPTVLRTLFLTFENPEWETELAAFKNTDVEVPATLVVDGKSYPNVGVHFRGMSSFGMVPAGSKRSLNLSLDFVDEKQRLLGYKNLNLLNAADDPSFMSTVLYSHIARKYLPVPRANFMKVVINGESWGVYVNVQQFDKTFLEENYKTTKGTRWKVSGSPGGRGGLEYMGDDLEQYKRIFEIKSEDKDKPWKALVKLCRVLNQTPVENLEAAIKPLIDIDQLLWFLALDVTLVNNDGYWVRSSDYSIYQDKKGKFHILPHDMNEAFQARAGGPGMPGFGPGGPGFGPGGPDTILPPWFRGPLELSEAQEKQLDALRKEADARLAKILTPEQQKQLKDLTSGPPGGFGPPGGGRGGPGGAGGVNLDPLTALDDPRKPLRSKILKVPSLRKRYLECVKTLAEKELDWNNLGPVVASYRKLIEAEIQADTRKLYSIDAFRRSTADTPAPGASSPSGGRAAGGLRDFADQRRAFLLKNPEIQKLGSP